MGIVNITLANGRLGSTLQTNDGIVGLVLTGNAVPGTYEISTPVLITGLDGLNVLGINNSNNPFAYRQIKEYYEEAGTGARLYFMLTGADVTITDIADMGNEHGARVLIDYAAGKIRVLGIMTDDVAVAASTSTPVTTAEGINDGIYTAATRMKVMCDHYFQAQQPFRAIIGGTSYSGDIAALRDMTTGTTNNRTSILVGNTQAGAGACLGLLLGRLSVIPVMRKVSRVRTGAMTNSSAYLGSDRLEIILNNAPVIASKGFITWCMYPNVSGYFFSGDDTCSSTTDDYHFLARGRVIDKAHILAYTTFIQEVDDEVPVNDDGTLDAGFCKWLSQQIINQVNNTMTVNKEISSVSCSIDPQQNILSTNKLNVVLQIVPVGYATNIEINLGFDNPAL